MKDHIEPPMSSPAPFLLAVAIAAVIVLGGLMAIDAVWLASDPVTIASPASTATPTAPAG